MGSLCIVPSPTGLDHSWQKPLVGHFSEADATDAEVTHITAIAAALAAAGVSPDFELGLSFLLDDQALFGHGFPTVAGLVCSGGRFTLLREVPPHLARG